MTKSIPKPGPLGPIIDHPGPPITDCVFPTLTVGPVGQNTTLLKRLDWARFWTSPNWYRVLWSDESKFKIFGSKRRQYIRRSAGERMSDHCIIPTVKLGGGCVMVWGCFGAGGNAGIVKIKILNKEGYRQILKDHVISSGKCLIGNNFLFHKIMTQSIQPWL
ncbi:unnamed protein product [Gordionus sp. m RMFG-2023]